MKWIIAYFCSILVRIVPPVLIVYIRNVLRFSFRDSGSFTLNSFHTVSVGKGYSNSFHALLSKKGAEPICSSSGQSLRPVRKNAHRYLK